jgi:tol-pal system protein YbgF
MMFSRRLVNGFAGGLLVLACGAAAAQEGAGAPASASSPSQPQPDRLSELYYQLQVLQQEVQELRGLVEEQGHQLKRLARDQQEQYIDLDRRVAGLTSGGAPRPSGGPSGAGTPAYGTTTPEPSSGAPAAGSAAMSAAASASERDSYQNAFDLMKARKFDDSIAAFNRLIRDYPNGQYTPNAYYWLGELYLAQQNIEQARQSFMQVINLYPDHPKVPDTLYKLGVVYHRMGDTSRAVEYFNQVQSQYPQSSAAGLAASYQQELR